MLRWVPALLLACIPAVRSCIKAGKHAREQYSTLHKTYPCSQPADTYCKCVLCDKTKGDPGTWACDDGTGTTIPCSWVCDAYAAGKLKCSSYLAQAVFFVWFLGERGTHDGGECRCVTIPYTLCQDPRCSSVHR